MIQINLVPVDLRKRRKSQFLFGKINIPLEVIIGCGGGLLFLLVAVHAVIIFINVGKLAQHKALQMQREGMRAEKENVDSVVSELRTFQSKYNVLKEVTMEGELSWAQKLNFMSDILPRGMWFKKISLDNNMLFIEGSTIAQESNEIVSVSRLISSLKGNAEFMENFTELEFGSIQRRRIKNVEIADFVITMKLK